MEWTDRNCRLCAIFISLGVCMHYAFHLEQINSTVLGQVHYSGQDGNAAGIRDETSETDHSR